MADFVWTPPYPNWHNYDPVTGVGTADTPISAAALQSIQNGILGGAAQANAAMAAAGSVIAPAGTTPGYVLTVQPDGSVTWSAPTATGSAGIVPNYDGTATVSANGGSAVTLTPNLDGTDLFTGSGATPNHDGTILLVGSGVTPNNDGTIHTL